MTVDKQQSKKWGQSRYTAPDSYGPQLFHPLLEVADLEWLERFTKPVL
ncbi:MAG: hypothetical protein ACI9B8_001954 [Sulfitobacter sp.]|jgi:hypothetical protein